MATAPGLVEMGAASAEKSPDSGKKDINSAGGLPTPSRSGAAAGTDKKRDGTAPPAETAASKEEVACTQWSAIARQSIAYEPT